MGLMVYEHGLCRGGMSEWTESIHADFAMLYKKITSDFVRG